MRQRNPLIKLGILFGGILLGILIAILLIPVGFLAVLEATLPSVSPPNSCPDFSCVTVNDQLVSEGDEREKAVAILSSTAWHHAACILTDTYAQDVFLFGPKHPDRAVYFVVQARGSDGKLRVVQLGSSGLSMRHAFDRCLAPDIWDSPFEKPEVLLAIIGGLLTLVGWKANGQVAGRWLIVFGSSLIGFGLIVMGLYALL